jgi:hypothetical protein
MTIAILSVSAVLLVWFFGCIVTYRVGKRVLVEGMGVKSAEAVMFALFLISLLCFVFYSAVGEWMMAAVLLLWLVVQFFCHWYYTLFGVGEQKLKGYNECFANTVRLFPMSDTRLVPDLYHIVLHTLILADLVLVTVRCFQTV